MKKMKKMSWGILAVLLLLAFAASACAADWGFSMNDYQAAVNEGASSGGPGQKCFEIGLKVLAGNVEGQSFMMSGKTIAEVFRPGSQPRYDADIMNSMRKHIQNMGLMFSHMQLSEAKFQKVRQDFVDYAINTKIDFYMVDAQRKYPGYVFSFMSMLTNDPSWTSWRGHALGGDGTLRFSGTLLGHLVIGAPYTLGLYPPGETLFNNNPILVTPAFITRAPETRIQLTTGTAAAVTPPATLTPTPTKPPATPPAIATPTASGSNEWVFVGMYNNEKEWKEDEKQANYLFKRSASSNFATIIKTYVGPDSKGEHTAAKIDWTSPPNIIKPDQKFAMQINIHIAPQGLSGGGGVASLEERWFDEKGNKIAGGSMSNKDSAANSEAKNIHSATIYGYLSSGRKKGERRAVDIHTGIGGPRVLTSYIYEWR